MATAVTVPRLGDEMRSAILIRFLVPVGASVRSGPMTYAVGGKQHVTVAAGSALFSFALR